MYTLVVLPLFIFKSAFRRIGRPYCLRLKIRRKIWLLPYQRQLNPNTGSQMFKSPPVSHSARYALTRTTFSTHSLIAFHCLQNHSFIYLTINKIKFLNSLKTSLKFPILKFKIITKLTY